MLPEGRCIALKRGILENNVILGKLPPLSWGKKKKMAVELVIPIMLYHQDQLNVLILQDLDCYKTLQKWITMVA